MSINPKISSYSQAIKYLYMYIPRGREFMFPGNLGLMRMRYLLHQLGDPQNEVKVIHVAGTSGKGSTSFFISTIVRSLGFNVGLSLSPHLLDIRERFMVNNKLISTDKFCEYLNEVKQVMEDVGKTEFGTPLYLEVTVALAYYIFAKLNLDYAVMETGLGGLYDATNVVDRPEKLAVITKIGHDHTKILGNTLSKIAYQKAGIIQIGNTVVTLKQDKRALEVIEKEAADKGAKIYVIEKSSYSRIVLIPEPKFDFQFLDTLIKDIRLKMIGSFQVENCCLALSAATYLSSRDGFVIHADKIRKSLAKELFKGRMQKMTVRGQQVILDGAHNPQKMAEFMKNLTRYYPDQKFVFLVAFKKGKDYKEMLKYVIPHASKIIVTSFFNQTKVQGMVTIAEEVKVIARVLDELSFRSYTLREDNKQALEMLLDDARGTKVITGSLYLLGEVYPSL